jgi:hypothetical protein
MIKQTCGPIYALVIASLMVPAVAMDRLHAQMQASTTDVLIGRHDSVLRTSAR